MNQSKSRRAIVQPILPTVDEALQTLAASRTMARAYANHPMESDAIQLARSFTLSIVSAWWLAILKGNAAQPLRPLTMSDELPQLPEPLTGLARTIGAAAAVLPADEAGYQLGLAYTSMLPSGFRARNGIYYTPPALAERMLDQVTAAGLDWKKAHVLDPACGGGAFLAPVAKRIIAALTHCTPAIIVSNIGTRLAGYELDPFAAWLSQVTLDAVVLPITLKAKRQLGNLVTVGDTLMMTEPTRRFDLVIGNPPYGRVRLSAEQRLHFQRSLFGHANLYALFMDIAVRHAKTGGYLAYLTPTSFLAGEYFKNLRSMLAVEARPVTLDFVTVRKGVFEEVLQEVILATYQRFSKRKTADVHIIEPRSATRYLIWPVGTFRLPTDTSQPWLMARSEANAPLLRQLSKFKHRLADWGYGVSTGPLVWNRHKTQLCKTASAETLPLIWAESVTSDGRFEFRAVKRNHAPYFRIEDGDNWLIIRQPCVLLQRTTAKEQDRRLIAAALPDAFLAQHKAVVIENHLNMVKPITAMPKVPPAVIAAFLNTHAADQAFRCVSGSVAVSAYELESLPLPSPTALKPLAKLVANGASRAAIDEACTRLYTGGNA